MPDVPNRRAPIDPNWINFEQKQEVEYWANQFKVDILTLKVAIIIAGPRVGNVRQWLEDKGKI